METLIKETVKNIFKTNTFENALDLTRDLRGEYIREFGVKSWNGLVTYFRKANIIPEEIVSEPVEEMIPSNAKSQTEPVEEENETSTTDEIQNVNEPVVDNEKEDALEEPEIVEYMLYRNEGDKVEWFGHRENFYGLNVGDSARMIRMNNKGVNKGLVVATNALTLDDVALFHRCYAVIIRMKRSYKEQLDLAATCLMKIPMAINREYHRVPTSDTKLTDYVLNFNK